MATPFDRASIENQVHNFLESEGVVIPEGHKTAVVAHVDEIGVKVVTAVKFNDNWKVQGITHVSYKGKLEGGLVFQGSW